MQALCQPRLADVNPALPRAHPRQSKALGRRCVFTHEPPAQGVEFQAREHSVVRRQKVRDEEVVP